MTDNEIIKGLECCTDHRVGACLACPYKDKKEADMVFCVGLVRRDALDLLKRQKELLDAAIAGQETLQKHIEKQDDELEKVRAERAVNVKAYIEAVAAFEAEKTEKERILKEFFAELEGLMLDGAIGGKYAAKVINPDKYAEFKHKYTEGEK